jgi:hypothetical protein
LVKTEIINAKKMLRFETMQDVWKEYIKLINENEST